MKDDTRKGNYHARTRHRGLLLHFSLSNDNQANSSVADSHLRILHSLSSLDFNSPRRFLLGKSIKLLGTSVLRIKFDIDVRLVFEGNIWAQKEIN